MPRVVTLDSTGWTEVGSCRSVGPEHLDGGGVHYREERGSSSDHIVLGAWTTTPATSVGNTKDPVGVGSATQVSTGSSAPAVTWEGSGRRSLLPTPLHPLWFPGTRVRSRGGKRPPFLCGCAGNGCPGRWWGRDGMVPVVSGSRVHRLLPSHLPEGGVQDHHEPFLRETTDPP